MKKKKQSTIAIIGPEEAARCSVSLLEKAELLGQKIAKTNSIIYTGGGYGFSYFVARGAFRSGATVIALSPAATKEEHISVYKFPEEYFSSIIYTGLGSTGRDLMLARSTDKLITAGEGFDKLTDFIIGLQDDHVVGILEGDKLSTKREFQFKEMSASHACLYVGSDPIKLVDSLLAEE